MLSRIKEWVEDRREDIAWTAAAIFLLAFAQAVADEIERDRQARHLDAIIRGESR